MEDVERYDNNLRLLNDLTYNGIVDSLTLLRGRIRIAKKGTNDQDLIAIYNLIDDAAGEIYIHLRRMGAYGMIGSRNPIWQNLSSAIMDAWNYFNPRNIDISIGNGYIEIFADPLLPDVFFRIIHVTIRRFDLVSVVRISSRHYGGGLFIIWEDDGEGYPPDEKEEIFTPEYGLRSGNGLFPSREILGVTGIEIHESGKAGVGTRFEIKIPEGKYRFTEPR